jgi:hypothetical protein
MVRRFEGDAYLTGVGVFPDNGAVGRLRIVKCALLVPGSRKESLVHERPDVGRNGLGRNTTKHKAKQI